MKKRTLPKVPSQIATPFNELVDILDGFCKAKLIDEYFELAVELAAKLARKRPSPLLSGSNKTWAAGIVHALGMVNFLFDKSQNPHLTSKDLCEWFSLGQSTISGKSKAIREMFKMSQFEPNWWLPSRLDDNPLVWMIMVNGMLLDARKAPYEIQVAAYEAGAIPYIPNKKAA